MAILSYNFTRELYGSEVAFVSFLWPEYEGTCNEGIIRNTRVPLSKRSPLMSYSTTGNLPSGLSMDNYYVDVRNWMFVMLVTNPEKSKALKASWHLPVQLLLVCPSPFQIATFSEEFTMTPPLLPQASSVPGPQIWVQLKGEHYMLAMTTTQIHLPMPRRRVVATRTNCIQQGVWCWRWFDAGWLDISWFYCVCFTWSYCPATPNTVSLRAAHDCAPRAGFLVKVVPPFAEAKERAKGKRMCFQAGLLLLTCMY